MTCALYVILIEFSYSVLRSFDAIHAADLMASLCIFPSSAAAPTFHSTLVDDDVVAHSALIFHFPTERISLDKKCLLKRDDDDDVHKKD